jgi:hypothetical protein
MIPAFTLIIPTVTGNNVIVSETPERIVSKAAHVTLASAAAQARNSFIDLMAVWKELATPRKKRKSFTTTDSNLASSGANRGGRSGSRYIIGGKKEDKRRKACEAKARNKNNKIRK